MGEIGWELGSRTSSHKSRVQRTLRAQVVPDCGVTENARFCYKEDIVVGMKTNLNLNSCQYYVRHLVTVSFTHLLL